MNRSIDYDQHLAEELQSLEFAREYFTSSMESWDDEPGLPLFEALCNIIRKMGVKEYAELIDMQAANLTRILSQNSPPKIDTLNRLLEPLNYRVKLTIEEVA